MATAVAEGIVAEAIHGRRDECFIVSKVLPENATRAGTIAACERSLKRLKTDRIDLYLLHWRGRPSSRRRLSAFEALIAAGKIRIGASAISTSSDMEELLALPGGTAVRHQPGALQSARGAASKRACCPGAATRRIPIMAYSPIEQGRLLARPRADAVADRHRATPGADRARLGAPATTT